PFLYPVFNRLTLAVINLLLRVKPDQIQLKKAGGMIAAMLGRAPTLSRVGRSRLEADNLRGKVRAMREADLGSVAKIHLASFPNDILSRLGRRCVLAQYRWLLANYGDCNLVCDDGGEVVGFAASGDRSYRPRMWRAIALWALLGLLRHPGLVLAIITERRDKLMADRTRAGPATTPSGIHHCSPFDLRLVTLAVARSCRKRGIAGTLLDEVAERAKRHNARFMMSHTLEPEMMSVFDRHDWEVHVESEREGKLCREYRKYFRR
ncbi:MAG: GNAT family N-acetyltransferase, partial [Candidatus Binatia bacterium]